MWDIRYSWYFIVGLYLNTSCFYWWIYPLVIKSSMGDFLLPRLMTPEGNRGTIPKWPSFKWANLCIQQMLHENHHFTWFWMVNSHDIHILVDYSSVWWTIQASVYVAQWSWTVEFRWILPILMACYSSKRRVYEHFLGFHPLTKREMACPLTNFWVFPPRKMKTMASVF